MLLWRVNIKPPTDVLLWLVQIPRTRGSVTLYHPIDTSLESESQDPAQMGDKPRNCRKCIRIDRPLDNWWRVYNSFLLSQPLQDIFICLASAKRELLGTNVEGSLFKMVAIWLLFYEDKQNWDDKISIVAGFKDPPSPSLDILGPPIFQWIFFSGVPLFSSPPPT